MLIPILMWAAPGIRLVSFKELEPKIWLNPDQPAANGTHEREKTG